MADALDSFLNYRLGQLAEDATIREWLGRAMVLVDESGRRRVVGSIGFHGPPDEQGRLEIGYSVDPPYRRQGYAREAVRGDVRLGLLGARHNYVHSLDIARQRAVADA